MSTSLTQGGGREPASLTRGPSACSSPLVPRSHSACSSPSACSHPPSRSASRRLLMPRCPLVLRRALERGTPSTYGGLPTDYGSTSYVSVPRGGMMPVLGVGRSQSKLGFSFSHQSDNMDVLQCKRDAVCLQQSRGPRRFHLLPPSYGKVCMFTSTVDTSSAS